MPGLTEALTFEISRVSSLKDSLRALECYRDTSAMLRLADRAIGHCEAAKQRRGVLDFDDLIVKTAALLSRSEAARWVQYKLDRGLDHILVDEAQDTSPRQWQVIGALTEDFFAGEGASRATRTFFAVGDEKQSIFSFQGSVPAWFALTREAFARRTRQAGSRFAEVGLHLSFRSAPIVLDAVDKVFAAAAAQAGVVSGGAWPPHTAARHAAPGRVAIWPPIARPEKEEAADWTAPLDRRSEESPEVALAERIAATIAGWLGTGERLDSGALIRAGGILILTRSRGIETAAIHRALKRRAIPFAGADRLRLTEHIAVMDLLALGKVTLMPEDDLTLAALLKSPLLGLSEDDLFALAHGRRGTLWEALGDAAGSEPFAEARRKLDAWRALADFVTPHAFYARVLAADGGRRAFIARLGIEAEDVIDEFLAQALAYEKAETPSLQGFVAWLESDPTDIRRDTDMLRDEVRVMTVHGAKGLEADIVFLVDNGAAPVHGNHVPKLVALGDENADLPPPLVWVTSPAAMPAIVSDEIERLKEKAREEYRRLLYVAMTRARDRLYVVGTDKKVSEDDRPRRWHALVTAALEPECRPLLDAAGNPVALEWRADGAPPPAGEGAATAAPAAPPAIPDWARAPAPPAPPRLPRLVPSAIDGGPAGASVLADLAARLDPAREAALRRGRLVHRLLQSLPGRDPAERRPVGERFLAAVAGDLGTAWCASLLGEVLAVLEAPDFAPVFAPGSRAEVEIAGTVRTAQGDAPVSGRIDRLAVTADRILIVDYKTNRPAPDALAAVPPAYVVQLALYRLVLSGLYPGRPVSAALLWTDRPALMAIPSELLDSAISRLVGG